MEDHFTKFRVSDALLSVYKLIWNDFCSWYLEWVKPPFGDPIDLHTKKATIALFEDVLRILHPFMPFLTEELWQTITSRKTEESLIISSWPEAQKFDNEILNEIELLFEITNQIRNTRNSKQISPKEVLPLSINSPDGHFKAFESSLIKLK